MMIMMQVLWCCRMKHCGLLTIGILQSICAILSFFAAIYMLVSWRDDRWCNVWLLNIDEGAFEVLASHGEAAGLVFLTF